MICESIGKVPWTKDDIIFELEMFLDIYERRPIMDNRGGMNSSHLFPTWFLCKRLQPRYIIESGVWKGLGTWMLSQASPCSRIISLDPVTETRQYTVPGVEYTTEDFAIKDWDFISEEDKARSQCFFDDHQGAGRLRQAQNLGFKHILYEDNYSDGRGHEGKFDLPNEDISPKSALAGLNTILGEWIRQNTEIYYEFPPVFTAVDSSRGAEWANISRQEYLDITPRPLLSQYEEKYKVFYDESSGYTWLCYIKLGELK